MDKNLFDYCPSQHGRNTLCDGASEERWRTLTVGHFVWSPTATGILNQVLHPVAFLLILTLLLFLIIVVYVKVKMIMKQLAYQLPPLILDSPSVHVMSFLSST